MAAAGVTVAAAVAAAAAVRISVLTIACSMTALGRKSPLGGYGWVSPPERRETATTGRTQWSRASRTEDAEQPFALPEYLVGDALELLQNKILQNQQEGRSTPLRAKIPLPLIYINQTGSTPC